MTPTTAEQIGAILHAAAAIPPALQALRDATAEQEWADLYNIPALEMLIDLCTDLEHAIETGPL